MTSALATQKPSAGAMVKQYRADFASVLPSHIRADTWVRVAQGALKKGKKHYENGRDTGLYVLEVAALNNPGAFLAALLDSARQGLEPGTEQYYLTPRKVNGQLQIQGITGYQGYVELMYRAGAVASVIVENVYTGDGFTYRPGRDERPLHDIDWDAEARGDLRLVYAYAIMRDGATSKVVVLNRKQIDKIKSSSASASYDDSPWQTHPDAMWLKSAARQLAKWVPTSAEYRKEQLRAAQEVAAETRHEVTIAPQPAADGEYVDPVTGEVYSDAEPVEGELVEEPPGWEK